MEVALAAVSTLPTTDNQARAIVAITALHLKLLALTPPGSVPIDPEPLLSPECFVVQIRKVLASK